MLVASPFKTFASLSNFHQAVRELPGVLDVRAVSFENKTLHLAIRYAGVLPLAGFLTELRGLRFHFIAIDDGKIEVELE